jgi:hypothetical protein
MELGKLSNERKYAGWRRGLFKLESIDSVTV